MPLWAKVDVDMPTDEKLLGQPVATRHLWTCLICLAKKQDHAGAIKGFDPALLAGRFNLPRKAVADAMTHYQAASMVHTEADGTIRLLHFVERQGESVADQREKWRARKAKERSDVTRDIEQTSRVTQPVTHGNGHAGVTLLEVEREEEIDGEKETASQGVKPPAPTAAVWTAYSRAFKKRYRVEPVRNATVNGLLAHFITRMPATDAPSVAEFYLTRNDAYYVKSGHSVKAMIADAEKLHAASSGARMVMGTEANQIDRTQANLDGWAELMSEEGRNALVGK